MSPKILLFFLICGIKLSGQTVKNDSLQFKYNNQTIYRYGTSFMKGNERLTFKDLSKEFSMSTLGLELYQKAKKHSTISRIFMYASVFAGVAAIGVLADHGNRDLVYGLYAGQFALMFGGMRYRSLSMQSLDRALWQRNKDVLFPPSQ